MFSFMDLELEWIWIFKSLKKCGLDWHFRSILTAEFQVHNFGLDCGFFTTMQFQLRGPGWLPGTVEVCEAII